MSDTGTVDITSAVGVLQSEFVNWATAAIYGEEVATPALSWVALPVISELDQELIKAVLTALANFEVMQAFFLNTALKKASQAQDFVDTITKLNSLPPTATSEEYASAEKARIAAFTAFVTITT